MVYPYARVKLHKCEKILSITGLREAVCIGQRGILKTNSIKELTMAPPLTNFESEICNQSFKGLSNQADNK